MCGEIELCPTEIRFIHDEVNERFGRRRKRGGYVNDVIESITQGLMNVYTLPKIRVVRLEEKNNYYYAFDNRRLYVYRTLHLRGKLDKVKVRLADPSQFQPRRFNTRNNGKSVRLKSDICIPTTLRHSDAVSPPPSPTPHRSADESSASSSLDVEDPVVEAVAAAVAFILESVSAACGDEENQTNTDANNGGQVIVEPVNPVFTFPTIPTAVFDEEILENTVANSIEGQEVSVPTATTFKLESAHALVVNEKSRKIFESNWNDGQEELAVSTSNFEPVFVATINFTGESQRNSETILSDEDEKYIVTNSKDDEQETKPATLYSKLALADDHLIEESQKDAEIRTIGEDKNLPTFAEENISLNNTEQNKDGKKNLLDSTEATGLNTMTEVANMNEQEEAITQFPPKDGWLYLFKAGSCSKLSTNSYENYQTQDDTMIKSEKVIGDDYVTQPNEEDTSLEISDKDFPCSSNKKRSFDPEGEVSEDHKRFKEALGKSRQVFITNRLSQGPDISPAVYSLLQHCQPTSASVERSFSMLRKLLAKDRNFKAENVKHYMILHFNSCSW